MQDCPPGNPVAEPDALGFMDAPLPTYQSGPVLDGLYEEIFGEPPPYSFDSAGND